MPLPLVAVASASGNRRYIGGVHITVYTALCAAAHHVYEMEHDVLLHITAPASHAVESTCRSQAAAILDTFYRPSPSPRVGRVSPPRGEDTDSLATPVSVIPESPSQYFQRDEDEPVAPSLQPHAPPQPARRLPAEKKQQPLLPPPETGPETEPDLELNNINTTTTTAQPSNNERDNRNSHCSGQDHDGDGINNNTLPLTIQPPPPPVSSTPFTTHITATLALLSERLKPSRTFVPAYTTREVGVLERGYWFVRIPVSPTGAAEKGNKSWDNGLLARFTSFLHEFIAVEGRAGWGVWCFLDCDHDCRRLGQERMEAETAYALKVYTWGEVIMHVYLLLFLASERRIRRMEAAWIDSAERVVVQMP